MCHGDFSGYADTEWCVYRDWQDHSCCTMMCVCVCVYVMYTHTHDSLCTNVRRCNDTYIIYIYIHIYIQYILICIYIYIIHIINNIYVYIYIYYTSYINRLLLFVYLFFVLFPLSWRKTLVGEGWSWIYIIHMLYSIALVMVVGTPAILGYTVQM